MPAYVIAVVTEAHDHEALAEYRRRNTETVAAHGGRFVVRGGPVEVIEGDLAPLRMVVMEFDDADAARAWYRSDDYQAIAPIRQGASTTEMVLVEGVAPA
jgi:uncharacterized protein (DUF1330 family)